MTATADIVALVPRVQRVARNIANSLPPSISDDDLAGAGLVALVEVAKIHDKSRSSLWTYAYARIRGAMIDELRRTGPVSRWGIVRAVPTDRLDAATADKRKPQHKQPAGIELEARDAAESAMRCALLSDREREFAWLYWGRSLTLLEISKRFDVSESRISQIKTAVRKRLNMDRSASSRSRRTPHTTGRSEERWHEKKGPRPS